jgi:predicted short-subunit dehydrogenase-like oxidoreductase (DUF2520 family)
MKVILIGTGRVALNLGHAMVRTGISLAGISGRDASRTKSLADDLGTRSFALDEDLPAADVILIAVSDDAIASVAERIKTDGAVVAHTSGASSMDLLPSHSDRGVLWPVQTFIADKKADMKDIPLIVEGSNERASNTIHELASRMGGRVIALDHEQRQRLHLAAVFTSNFPVILMIEAQKLLRAEGLPEDLLLPLWSTTAANVAAIRPEHALTGPARRKDLQTIQRHLALLEKDPELRQLYSMLSERILRE